MELEGVLSVKKNIICVKLFCMRNSDHNHESILQFNSHLPLSGALRAAALVATGVEVLFAASEVEVEASWAFSAATCCSELRNKSLVFWCKTF